MSWLDSPMPTWIAAPLIALFLWAECLDCVGLRSLLQWWRS